MDETKQSPTLGVSSRIALVLRPLEKLVLLFYWLQDHSSWRPWLRVAAFGCVVASATVAGVWPESNPATVPIFGLLILGALLAGASVIDKSGWGWGVPFALFVAVMTGFMGLVVVVIVVLTVDPLQF